jgi:hypothetical protein
MTLDTPGVWTLLSAGQVLLQGPFSACLAYALDLGSTRRWVIVRDRKVQA